MGTHLRVPARFRYRVHPRIVHYPRVPVACTRLLRDWRDRDRHADLLVPGRQARDADWGDFAVRPDEPHTGEPATTTGFTYRTFYPSVALMQFAAAERAGRRQSTPFFPASVIIDPALSRQLLVLHRTLTGPIAAMEGETRVLQAFIAMIGHHADSRNDTRSFGREHAAIRRIREYIDAHYDHDISLHSYLESVRIRQAQRLVARGMPLAQVASATGFADQSHFTHRFKRLIGVTPGQYARQRKIIQDGASCGLYAGEKGAERPIEQVQRG